MPSCSMSTTVRMSPSKARNTADKAPGIPAKGSRKLTQATWELAILRVRPSAVKSSPLLLLFHHLILRRQKKSMDPPGPRPRIPGKRFSCSQPTARRWGLREPLSSFGCLPSTVMVGDESRKSCCFRLAARSNPVLEKRLCISLHLSTVVILEVNRQLAGPFHVPEAPLPLLKQPIRDRAYQEGQGNHGQAHGVGSLVRQGKQHVRRGRLPNSSISRVGGGANKRQEPRFNCLLDVTMSAPLAGPSWC